jgi:hypothetical protein
MLEALAADGPHADQAEKLMLFGRLVGSWDTRGQTFDASGAVVREATGEWHFGWVLEGRGIEDVIISPPREGRAAGETSKAYDAAVRVYDPAIDAWHMTVVAPIYGVALNLVAREHGDDIWIEGQGPGSVQIRWTFSEIGRERVRWQGFVSSADGSSWIRDEEIILTRRPMRRPRGRCRSLSPRCLPGSRMR